MSEFEDSIQHVGIKGMRWGVRRSRGSIGTAIKNKRAASKERTKSDKEVRRKMKSKEITKKQARAALLENVHKSNSSSKTYLRKYNKRVKMGQSHTTAIRGATADTKAVNAMRMKVGTAAAMVAAKQGSALARKAYSTATTPENIRRGKNVVQAMKNSSVRYVDGSKMTNVI